MTMKKVVLTLCLLFFLTWCINPELSIKFYPDTFSSIYTCPALGITNNTYIRDNGTAIIMYSKLRQSFTYKRISRNLYHLFESSTLDSIHSKILIFDDYYVRFRSTDNDKTLLSMSEEMIEDGDYIKCTQREL